MKVAKSHRSYSLNELGSNNKQTFEFVATPRSITTSNRRWFGKDELALLHVLILRSLYLNQVLPCEETADAIALLRAAHHELAHKFASHTIEGPVVFERVKGHTYVITGARDLTRRTLVFIRRSGGAVQYKSEWPGLQSQEVMRMLIHRLKSINREQNRQLFNLELHFIRNALYMYEIRAQRRKAEQANRRRLNHDDQTRIKPWRIEARMIETIEHMKTGPDGHITTTLI